MIIRRTRDFALVRELLASDARIYDAACDDAAPPREAFRPNAHPAIWYAIAGDERGAIALYSCIPQNAVTWEIHASHVFGARAAVAARSIAPWLAAQTGARRVVCSIPATNRAAIRAARRAGFVEYGRNPRSFLKRGELLDQVLLGISAE